MSTLFPDGVGDQGVDMMAQIGWLALAGMAGTLARFSLAGVVQRATGAGFPWGTLAANSAGCFLAGLAWTLLEERFALSATARTAIMVGFMGAFTTFSSMILETSELIREAQWSLALANLTLQHLLGFGALFAGFGLARLL